MHGWMYLAEKLSRMQQAIIGTVCFVADDELVTGESEEKVVKNVRQCVQKSLCVLGEHAFLWRHIFSFLSTIRIVSNTIYFHEVAVSIQYES